MEPGIHFDISNEDYHAWTGAIGASGLKDVRRSPAYFYGQRLDPNRPRVVEKPDDGARLFGSMSHCALFEPDQLAYRYPVGVPDPKLKSPKNGKEWQELKARYAAEDRTLVDGEQYLAATRVRDACMAVPGIARWFEPGKWRGEVTIVARDPETGALCKIRCDLLHFVSEREVVILDGKSYATVMEDDFARQVARMLYDLQTAFYFDVATWAGYTVLAHMYLGYESEYPHLPRLFELDAVSFASGRRKYREALNTYARCLKNNDWPGHPDEIVTITLPTYALEAA